MKNKKPTAYEITSKVSLLKQIAYLQKQVDELLIKVRMYEQNQKPALNTPQYPFPQIVTRPISHARSSTNVWYVTSTPTHTRSAFQDFFS